MSANRRAALAIAAFARGGAVHRVQHG
jgi:hypothetical protein